MALSRPTHQRVTQTIGQQLEIIYLSSHIQKGRYVMDVKTYLQRQMANVHSQIDTVMKDITDEIFNWPPSGAISPISAIFIHMLTAEDYFIQSIIQGKLPCWVTQEWDRKIDVPIVPEQGRSWEEFKTIQIQVAPVLSYEQIIRVATDGYLVDLTVDELDKQVNFLGEELSVAEVLIKLVVHSASHAGEIAAVKGMQGIKGLPY
jgi:hypothetical protein